MGSHRAQRLRDKWYPPEERDNDAFFLSLVREAVGADDRVLDAGAGAGDLFPYDLKGQVREMVGVDLDPRVAENPQLDRGIVCDLNEIPVDDGYFDLVFSRYVLEHVADPARFMGEVVRVLKPGGRFLFLTPNKWHYVALISRLTPQSFHEWFNRRRGRVEEDTFPTLYRLNSAADLRRSCGQAGLHERAVIFRECAPNYLTLTLPTFLAGVAYERLVNASNLLRRLRVNIIGDFEKRVG